MRATFFALRTTLLVPPPTLEESRGAIFAVRR
jgi:hypothetical protein